MRVLEQTPDRLVLEVRPIALMVMCVGLFLLFLVLGFGSSVLLPGFLALMGVQVPGIADVSIPGTNILGYAAVIPLAVGVFALKARRLTLDRRAGMVTLTSRGVFGTSKQSWPLGEFRGASLRRNSRAGNNSRTYTPMLEFSQQSVPVFPYGTSGSGPARLVEAVNAWFGPQANTITREGDMAAEVTAALAKLGIRPPR
jgi:hypothetical protein